MSDFPALENFLSAYFHQDWRVEHDAPDAAVSSFLDGEDTEKVAAVRAELARLSAQDMGEAALGNLTHVLGCEYDPTLHGARGHEWRAHRVGQLACRLRTAGEKGGGGGQARADESRGRRE